MLCDGLEALIRAHSEFQVTTVTDSLDEITAQLSDVAIALETNLDSRSDLPAIVAIWPTVEAAALRGLWAAGIRAVLPQDSTAAELVAAVQAAAAGLITLRPADIEAIPSEVRSSPGAVSLSPRELEVLRLVADGLANKEIAHRLGISEHTVKFHVNS